MDEYIGMIKMFGGNYPPIGYMFCDGSILAIAQNTALFSLLGTTYGGNGVTTFALPDFRGRTGIGYNQGAPGPGLSSYPLGAAAGSESVTLNTQQMPMHNHMMMVSNGNADQSVAVANASYIAAPGTLSGRSFTPSLGYSNTLTAVPLGPQSMTPAGGSQPHPNMQPYLAVSFIICVQGVYPSRP